jgi:hypothetical protein
MDFTSEKTSNLIEKGTAAGIGFLSFVKTSTAKFESMNPTGYGLLSRHRIEDSIACIIGGDNLKSIDAGSTSGTTMQFHPLNAINYTTEVGIGVLVTDWAMRSLVPHKYYKGLPIVPDFVRGAGIGLLVGGIVGGIFDPAPSGYTIVNPSPVTGQVETGGIATGNVPYARAGSTSAVYKGSILA